MSEELRVELARLDERLTSYDRRYTERFQLARAAIDAEFAAAKEAVEKAQAATENRFESVNGFRAQLSDQAAGLLPRAEYETQHREFGRRLDDIREQVAKNSLTMLSRNEYDSAHSDVVHQVDDLRDQLAALRQTVAVGPSALRALELRSQADQGERSARLDVRTVMLSVIGSLILLANVLSPHIH